MSAPWKGRWEELAQHQEMVVQALRVEVSPHFLGSSKGYIQNELQV
jgi:hypothetical protein